MSFVNSNESLDLSLEIVMEFMWNLVKLACTENSSTSYGPSATLVLLPIILKTFDQLTIIVCTHEY